MNFLSVEQLTKSYGDHVVFKDASMIIEQGQKVSFVGKNGEGKSTMIKAIMGEIDFEGKLDEYYKQGLSVGDLVRQGNVKVNESGIYKVSLEFDGMETSLIEQFRADFNNDGIEDIFVRGWTRAIGGTLGYGFTTILTRYSNKHLIEEIKSI